MSASPSKLMLQPLVSVVIATYNRSHLVSRAVDSVLAQEYGHIQLIVVDDGSTDDTGLVIAGYGARVKYIRQENRERGAARNAGVAASAGSLVAFLDSDDEMLSSHIGGLVDAFRARPEVGIAYRQTECFDDRSGTAFYVFPEKPLRGDPLLAVATDVRFALSSAMVRRSLLDEVGGFDEDRELAGAEDWELWVRCVAASPILYVPGVTIRLHTHSGNTVGDPVATERAVRAAIPKMLSKDLTADLLRPYRRQVQAGMMIAVVRQHLAYGTFRRAMSCLWQEMRADPRILIQRPVGQALTRAFPPKFLLRRWRRVASPSQR